jgi:hypothetical protein
VGQQLPGIFALQFQQAVVKKGHRLGEAEQFMVFHTIAGLIRARDIQVCPLTIPHC